MIVWMACDPQTGRISLQGREFMDIDFPPGFRGRDWEIRQGKLDDTVYADLLAGKIPWGEQTPIHLTTWEEAAPK